MSLWWLLTIICIIAIIPFVVWEIISQGDSMGAAAGIVCFAVVFVLFFCIAIAQPITIKRELLRQKKERQQILYQIENMNENSDKVKLNEWILTYNDWVNDVNTSKEIYGWASWYYSVDMSEHTIIELV